jgi:hypothetical protein
MTGRICLVVICCLLFQGTAAYGQTSKKTDRSAEWEYRQLSSPSDEVLNHYAKDGWEIITATGGGGDTTSFYRVILKRHKSHRLFGTKTAVPPKPEPPAQNTKCNLTLAQAPVIRGLRLGMTSDELFTIFPTTENEESNRARQLKNAELPPNYGYTSFQFNPSRYATKDRFTGIRNLDVGLYDRKIVYIRADYSNTSQFDSNGQFIEILSKHFGLPEFKDWAGYRASVYNPSLICDGFTFRVIGDSGSFSIELTDSTYKKIAEDRRQADRVKQRGGFKP